MEQIYISLGSDCSVAYQLQIRNLRKLALPFDWIRINNINSLIAVLETNFQYFLDNLIIERESDKFPIIAEDYIDTISKTLVIKNTRYNIMFPHEIKEEYELEIFKEKYYRRINRFIEIIKDPSIKKIFIRASNKTENIELLNKTLAKITNNYKLIAIEYDNKIKYSSWHHNEYQWESVLS